MWPSLGPASASARLPSAIFYNDRDSHLWPRGITAMRETWTFHSAGHLVFGRNAVRQLGDIAARLRARRILIVTDPVLVKAGLLERVREPLIAKGLEVDAFTGGEPEPSMRAA